MPKSALVTTVTFNHYGAIAKAAHALAGQVVKKIAFDIEGTVKTSMEGPKHGKIYARNSRTHQASAPGEAPAIDLGALHNSIQTARESELTWDVYTNMEYAPVLEYGGRRTAPRPFMRPAAERHRQPFILAMQQIVKDVK